MARFKPLSAAQVEMVDALYYYTEVWWHDLKPAATRDALYRRGFITRVRHVRCGTKGHRHPGYVTINRRGLSARRRTDL